MRFFSLSKVTLEARALLRPRGWELVYLVLPFDNLKLFIYHPRVVELTLYDTVSDYTHTTSRMGTLIRVAFPPSVIEKIVFTISAVPGLRQSLKASMSQDPNVIFSPAPCQGE